MFICPFWIILSFNCQTWGDGIFVCLIFYHVTIPCLFLSDSREDKGKHDRVWWELLLWDAKFWYLTKDTVHQCLRVA